MSHRFGRIAAAATLSLIICAAPAHANDTTPEPSPVATTLDAEVMLDELAAESTPPAGMDQGPMVEDLLAKTPPSQTGHPCEQGPTEADPCTDWADDLPMGDDLIVADQAADLLNELPNPYGAERPATGEVGDQSWTVETRAPRNDRPAPSLPHTGN